MNKVWKLDDGGMAAHSVIVYLLRDGIIYETVTLNNANNWTYTWTDLDDSYTWMVEEAIVTDGFTSSVVHEGIVWTITNDDTSQGGNPGGPSGTPTNTSSNNGNGNGESSGNGQKTGDEAHPGLYIALMMLALAGLGITLYAIKRKKYD